MLSKNQFSIGRMVYNTAFVATLVACVKTGYPYGFIYPAAFVVIVGCYGVWQISRPDLELPKESILDEWDAGENTSKAGRESRMTQSDQIWNRAAMDDGGSDPSPGDAALACLLYAHGLIMNGGVLHAIELMTRDELDSAVAGYRFFDFPAASDLLILVRYALESETITDSDDQMLNAEYLRLIPTDETLTQRFEKHYATNPSVYSPCEEIGG